MIFLQHYFSLELKRIRIKERATCSLTPRTLRNLYKMNYKSQHAITLRPSPTPTRQCKLVGSQVLSAQSGSL